MMAIFWSRCLIYWSCGFPYYFVCRLITSSSNLFEQIIDDRYHRKSLILSSQLFVVYLYSVFSNEMLAEAYLDRIVHKSFRFELKGDSIRKKY